MRDLAPLLALLLLVPACGRGEASGAPPADARRPAVAGRRYPVATEPARAGLLTSKLEASGALDAEQWVEVTAAVEGILGPPAFREGDRARPDAVLIEIDPERHRLACERAAAALLRVEADLHDKEDVLERRRQPAAKKAFTEEEVRHCEADVEQARAAEAEMKVLRDIAARDLDLSRVRAPLEGFIDKRTAVAGQYVKPGTLLAVVLRPKPLRLRFSIREEDVARVTAGAEVAFTVPAFGAESFPAKVFHVARAVDPATRRIEVLAAVPNEDERLRPGFFAKVTLETASPAPVVILPESAVLRTGDGHIAYVVAEGRAQKRVLAVGRQDLDGRYEVLGGVAAGEPVVVRGAAFLADGAAVEPR
jgi:membrane fusion protein (multidrug efflux system)